MPSVSAPGLDLPNLSVVSLAQLVLHEDADERRVGALAQKLQADGVLKNPPIVAPMADGRFVVLDGANRTSALRLLGVPNVVVQVADYGEVTLDTWFHLVTGIPAGEVLAGMRKVPDLTLTETPLDAARQALAERQSLAYLVAPDGRVHELRLREPRTKRPPTKPPSTMLPPIRSPSTKPPSTERDAMGQTAVDGLAVQTQALRRAVASYKGKATIQRIQTDNVAALRPVYPDIAALVVFPAYRSADILALAGQSVKLPTGITRHVIPRRALRLNTEIAFLWSEAPLAEKQRWLDEWTRHKLQAREIRYYQESTFLFDE